MFVEVTSRVELNYTQQEKVIVQILKNDYSSISNDVLELYAKDIYELESHELRDLNSYIKILKSIDGVLSYYMEHSEYMNWKRSNGNIVHFYEHDGSVYE